MNATQQTFGFLVAGGLVIGSAMLLERYNRTYAWYLVLVVLFGILLFRPATLSQITLVLGQASEAVKGA